MKGSEWIPASECLPDSLPGYEGGEVEVLCWDGDRVVSGFWGPAVRERQKIDYCFMTHPYGSFDTVEVKGVTHWAPWEPPESGS